MSDSEKEDGKDTIIVDSPELRRRFESDERAEFKEDKENDETNESESESDSDEKEPMKSSYPVEPVQMCRLARVSTPTRKPSFLCRQFRNIKAFFTELLNFIFLFLMTLFNPLADVNKQVEEHNKKRLAREGRFYQDNKPKNAPFPGCGPSS